MKNQVINYLIGIIAVFLISCSEQSSSSTNLKMVLVSPDTSIMDVYTDITNSIQSGFSATQVVEDIDYNEAISIPVSSGNTTYSFYNNSENPQNVDATLSLITSNITAGNTYTLFITGLQSLDSNNSLSIRGAMFLNDLTAPSTGTAKVRVIHLAPDTNPIYVFFNDTALDLNSDSATSEADRIAFTGDTPYQTVSSGALTIEADLDTDASSAEASENFTLESGKNYTVYLHGCNTPNTTGCGSHDLSLSILTDN